MSDDEVGAALRELPQHGLGLVVADVRLGHELRADPCSRGLRGVVALLVPAVVARLGRRRDRHLLDRSLLRCRRRERGTRCDHHGDRSQSGEHRYRKTPMHFGSSSSRIETFSRGLAKGHCTPRPPPLDTAVSAGRADVCLAHEGERVAP